MKKLFTALVILFLATVAFSGEWHIETVDSTGDVGECTSLALDSSGRPHISYRDDTNENLKYAYWNGSSWQIETVDSEEAVGKWTSLALDSSGHTHISYWDDTNDNLKYASWNGSSWHIETVDAAGDVGRFTSLALDSSGRPHISYGEYTGGYDYDLKYARWNGSSWQIETVDSEDVGYFTSLVLDSSGRPHITYFNNTSRALKYARWNGSSWQIETVDSTGDVGYYTSLALDSSGNPHISYFDETYDNLKYAYWEGGPAVEDVELAAEARDEGVLVGWTITGDIPSAIRVLRGDEEPAYISSTLPGDSSRYLDRGVEPGGSYVYWLEVTEADGTVERFGPTEAVTLPGVTFTLALYAAYPSPARDFVNFTYSITADGRVTLSVYDMSGRRVATLVDAELTAGRHEVFWSCAEVPSGVYLYRLVSAEGSLTHRLVIAR